MSNLLFCCSIFYKMKLPLIVVFNKCDVADAIKPIEWMQDIQKNINSRNKIQAEAGLLEL